MVVRLRLARHGSRNNPFYHVVAIRDKAARDARPIEKLGEYDPIPRPRQSGKQPVQAWEHVGVASSSAQDLRTQADRPILSSGLEGAGKPPMEKRIEWNVSRIHYWLGVGAQPSKPVARLLDRVSDDWLALSKCSTETFLAPTKAGLVPEGKWYKGMYRPPTEAASGTHGGQGSAILHAAEKQNATVKVAGLSSETGSAAAIADGTVQADVTGDSVAQAELRR